MAGSTEGRTQIDVSYLLKRHGHEWTRWSDKLSGRPSVERDEYLEAIRAADLGDQRLVV